MRYKEQSKHCGRNTHTWNQRINPTFSIYLKGTYSTRYYIMKILVLGNNKTLIKLGTKLLESRGHQLTVESNVKNALQLVKNNSFDVIMINLDVEGSTSLSTMNELDADKIIQNNNIITISRELTDETRKELQSRGIKYCFTMPIEFDTLIEAIDSFAS